MCSLILYIYIYITVARLPSAVMLNYVAKYCKYCEHARQQ